MTKNLKKISLNKRIKVNKRISFTIPRTKNQQCVLCGEKMGQKYAISMSNKGDTLILRKNLWMHIGCVPEFNELINKHFKKNKEKIIINSL